MKAAQKRLKNWAMIMVIRKYYKHVFFRMITTRTAYDLGDKRFRKAKII